MFKKLLFMRRLFLTPFCLLLMSPLQAGIPSSLSATKWVKYDESLKINVEDTKVGKKTIIVPVSRTSPGNEQVESSDLLLNYTGRIIVNCSKFISRIDVLRDNDALSYISAPTYYQLGLPTEIKTNHYAYNIANYLCFLTGIEGYTREENEPLWATKIIKSVERSSDKKSFKHNKVIINCDSPVWRNKPQCFD